MTAGVPELVRRSVESLAEPVTDADAVARIVVSRVGVSDLSTPSTRPRGRIAFAAAATALALVVGAVAVSAVRPDKPAATVDADVRYVPTYLPSGWALSSVGYQERRDDPALRSVQAFGSMDSTTGSVTDGFVVSSYRPAVERDLTGARVTAGGREMTVAESIKTIEFADAGYQVSLQYNGLTAAEAVAAAGKLRVRGDGSVVYPHHRPAFEATPPDFLAPGARWFDITLTAESGIPSRSPYITIGIRTGLIGPQPTAYAPGPATSVNGHPGSMPESDGTIIRWRDDSGSSLFVGGTLSEQEILKIAEGLRRATPEEWDAFVASAAESAPDVASGASDGIRWRERSNTRGGQWLELFVPVGDETVRISPTGGSLGTPVVRIGHQTLVGFVADQEVDGASVDGRPASTVRQVRIDEKRVAVVATFDELLDPTTITATIGGTARTVDVGVGLR